MGHVGHGSQGYSQSGDRATMRTVKIIENGWRFSKFPRWNWEGLLFLLMMLIAQGQVERAEATRMLSLNSLGVQITLMDVHLHHINEKTLELSKGSDILLTNLYFPWHWGPTRAVTQRISNQMGPM